MPCGRSDHHRHREPNPNPTPNPAADLITTVTENAYFGRCTSSAAVAGVALVKTAKTLLVATWTEPVAAASQHGQSAPLAAPQPCSRASSGRAWRLWAARHSQEEASPLGAQLLPRVLELAASKAADFTSFARAGIGHPTRAQDRRRFGGIHVK